MIVEHAQILSNVWHLLCPNNVPDGIYNISKSQRKHPIVLWAKRSLAHYDKILSVALHLANERRIRKYPKKYHKTEDVLKILCDHKPPIDNFELGNEWVDPLPCVPEEYKVDKYGKQLNAIVAYRLCYVGDKFEIIQNRWEPRAEIPHWFEKYKNYIEN